MVVLDPRRTETAKVADEHHFVRPGTDAVVLLAMLHVLLEEGLDHSPVVRRRRRPGRRGWSPTSPPSAPSSASGVPAETIRRLTRDFAAADGAAAYGRMGLSTQGFGSVCQWAINCLNLLTGNFDREGGVLFPEPAVDTSAGAGRPRPPRRLAQPRPRRPEFARRAAGGHAAPRRSRPPATARSGRW